MIKEEKRTLQRSSSFMVAFGIKNVKGYRGGGGGGGGLVYFSVFQFFFFFCFHIRVYWAIYIRRINMLSRYIPCRDWVLVFSRVWRCNNNIPLLFIYTPTTYTYCYIILFVYRAIETLCYEWRCALRGFSMLFPTSLRQKIGWSPCTCTVYRIIF